MKKSLNLLVIMLVLVLGALTTSVFTVEQRQYGIIFQLGEVRAVITEPGLYFKWPMIQNVVLLDSRILTLDSSKPELFMTSENKNVSVDSFVKWKIINPKLYYESFTGDEQKAEQRLWQTVNSGLREEFGKLVIHEVVSGKRDVIMDNMRVKANLDAQKIGVEIVDVRLKRVDLTDEISESVYNRMKKERELVANQLRSEGGAESEKIRADADKQSRIIEAEAYREAQKTRGEGDAKAAAIYAQAFNSSPEFYTFYRSLEAYRASFKDKNDVLVIEPNSEFFKYMKGAK